MDKKFFDGLEPEAIILERIMTSCEKVDTDKFLILVEAGTAEIRKFTYKLTTELDLFVKIFRDKVGFSRVMRILGISDEINTILLRPIMMRFGELMTQEGGYDLVSRFLSVCNVDQQQIICDITYRHAFALAQDKYGCLVLKKVITVADDIFKADFLEFVNVESNELSKNDLGISLIMHVLNLDYTRKTTLEYKRSHDLMAEFDEILSTTSDPAELHKLALKLTSDSDLFVEFFKTRRGSLMVQIVLGRSEETDAVFLEAIKQRFTDVTTHHYGYFILVRTTNVFRQRENLKPYHQLLRLIGAHALYLSKDPKMGNAVVQHAINLHIFDCTTFIAYGLHSHYVELSFLKYGSNIVEKLLGEETTTWLPLFLTVVEIVKCDEDTLVRMAKDEFGNKVLTKTFQVAKECNWGTLLLIDLVEKFEPLLDRLHGSRGENIAAIVDSFLESDSDTKTNSNTELEETDSNTELETELVKERIVSLETI